ncbi:hypothetical protein F5X99DRAFT_168342 [Biscogniauxia marginata]|nr:hypothetical protein F5X99DRAFT_168342 [Biscogniauxia marginata]
MPPRRKRSRVESSTPASTVGSRRRSHRISSGGKKSGYFEDAADDHSADDSAPRRKIARTKAPSARKAVKEDDSSEDVLQASAEDRDVDDNDDDDDDDGYDDETEEQEDEADEEDEEEESSPPPPKKRSRGRPPKSAPVKAPAGNAKAKAKKKANDDYDDDNNVKPMSKSKGKAKPKPEESEPEDDLDEDEDDDDDDDGPRVTFIPLPKLRDTGGVEYEDTRLHRNTLLFLGDLKANNERSWLKMHDPEYRRSLKDWESFVETLTERIIDADETIPELPLKDVIFRIYRDIRFSKDPTPYKPHYSAAWSRTGRKGPYACYYVHAEPGNCHVGGGIWHPDAGALARLRAGIDERPHRIRRVLTDPAFRRTFLSDDVGGEEEDGDDDDDDGGKVESAALLAFAGANQEGALKTKPKGFHPEHRDIELLKLRNFTIGKKIRDEDLMGEDAQEKIMSIFRPMVPFITYLNRTVMPDPDEDSDSEVEDGDEE